MINRKPGFVFWTGFVAILACLVYPPYHECAWNNDGRPHPDRVTYRYIFEDQPDPLSRVLYMVALSRLGIEFAGITALCALGYWLGAKKQWSKRDRGA